MRKKVNVYIDCENIDVAALRVEGKRVNYTALLAYLKNSYVQDNFSPIKNIVNVKAFIPIEQGDQNKERYITSLRKIGLNIFPTERTYLPLPEGNFVAKENSDLHIAAEITRDLIQGDITTFILISGDKDYVFLGKEIINQNKIFRVIGPRECTCVQYRSMNTFVYLHTIPNIFIKGFEKVSQGNYQNQFKEVF